MSRASLGRLALLALVWGSGFYLIAVALRGFDPWLLTVVRLALGALVLVPVIYARGERLPTDRASWGHLAVAALLGNTAPYLLFAISQEQLASSVAGVINATTPLWALVIASLVARRGPGSRQLLALAVGFAGTMLVFAPWRSASQAASWYGAAALTAAACYGAAYVYQHRYLTERGLSPLVLSAGQLAAATAQATLTLPIVQPAAPMLRADVVAAVLALGIASTGFGYVLNFRLIRDEGPTAASVVSYLIPIVAAVLGVFALHEPATLGLIAGGAVILVGVALLPTDRTVSSPAGPAEPLSRDG